MVKINQVLIVELNLPEQINAEHSGNEQILLPIEQGLGNGQPRHDDQRDCEQCTHYALGLFTNKPRMDIKVCLQICFVNDGNFPNVA